MKPLCVDLFCGLGGWAEGFLAEGYDVIGFDIERHDYGTGGYPGQLVLQDVRTLHGSQFKDATVIVASPPCQFPSRMAMPFKCPWSQEEFERRRDLFISLFHAFFRIAKEAGVALVVENVRGAQKWVGQAAWNFGSYYLWGDIPALMPFRVNGVKVPSFRFDGSGGSFQTASVRRTNPGNGALFTSRDYGVEGVKNRNDWFGSGEDCSLQRMAGSQSSARKAASAQIAKIPFPLANHIARVFK